LPGDEESAPEEAEQDLAPQPLSDEKLATAEAGHASPGHASPGHASPGHDVAAPHTAEYLPLEMSPEPDPSAIDVPIIDMQPEEQEWASAIDFDMPDLAEPLPLPEVEEISLDGTLLAEDWADDTSPQTTAQPQVAEGKDAPRPALAEVDSLATLSAEASDSSSGPRSHPLDAALLPEAGRPAIDSDSEAVVVPAAGLVTEKREMRAELPVLAVVEAGAGTRAARGPGRTSPTQAVQ
jgi:hypothetical protein